MRALALSSVVAVLAWAQAPTRLPVACTLELVRKLDLNCSFEEPCPLFLELSAAETVGDRLILAGNVHTSAETLESVLLLSDDAGKTWTEAHSRIPGAALTDIQFLDFEAGWISGHVLHPDARNPFLLLSKDGGKTWRNSPLYSEPKTGAIERFHFDSKTSGKMLVDRAQSGESGLRYELWESLTGGDSWNIRQVDATPIPFPGPPRAAKPLRIRADAATKTYRLEKQEGAQWRSLASFAVSLAPCKPEIEELKEAPPEPEPEPPPHPPNGKRPPSLKDRKK